MSFPWFSRYSRPAAVSTQSGSQEDERMDSLRITEKKAKIERLNYETLDLYKGSRCVKGPSPWH